MKEFLKLRFLFVICTVCLGCWRAPAQQLQSEDAQPIQRVSSPPPFGTFYLIQNKNSPPYPFDPFFGQLPVYEWKPGVYLVDDAAVDYVAWNEQKKAALKSGGGSGGMSMMSGPAPCEVCPTNGGGTNSASYAGGWTTNAGLKFATVPYFSGNNYITWLDEARTNAAYEIFQTLALQTNQASTLWQLVAFGSIGQSNFSFAMPATNAAFYLAASDADTDGDGLSDPFETLVVKSNPQNRDSDGDTILDGDEMGPNGLPWRLEQIRMRSIIVYANTPTATEGGTCGQFTVYLPTPAPTGGVTVKYHFGGSAVVTSEFTPTPSGNSLTIPAGSSSGAISVCAVNDGAYAGIERYLELTLTNATCCIVDAHSNVLSR